MQGSGGSGGSRADENVLQSHCATPPWCEHVPRRWRLKLYEPSRQRAVALLGALLLNTGRRTLSPSTLV